MKLENIQLHKKGASVVIWFGNVYHQYWDYTQSEAIHLFKKKYGIKGKVDKVNYCPFILN